MKDASVQDEVSEKVVKTPSKSWNSRDFGVGFLVKLVIMAIVNALGVYIIWSCWVVDSWGILTVMAVFVILLDWAYFTKKHSLPLKYILPGVLFLLAFQAYTILYTVYIATTNYGDGHNLDKEDAIVSIQAQSERRVDDTSYPLAVLVDGDTLGFAIVDGSDVKVGSADQPLTVESGAEVSGRKITSVPGWDIATINQIGARQSDIYDLRVPVSDNENQGSLRTQNGTSGYVTVPTMVYDEATDTMTDTATNTQYTADGKTGYFTTDSGQTLPTGWHVSVGFSNFVKGFSDARYAGPFWKVLAWTVSFSLISVVSTFLLGLFLASVFNEESLRGRKIYRTFLLLPYAFPAFLSALIWKGLLNTKFGFVNQMLLGGSEVNWLGDPWLARLSVLGVNLWLGFPYMFLIATGALQSIPGELKQAAMVDGATGMKSWLHITGPMVLVSTTPLLISSFAFNFNNFTLVYMLTKGGPRFTDTSAPVGATDLLISMVYSISGIDGRSSKDYGLASALSIIIFIVVGVVAAVGFRQSRKLEEVM
jgi:arabinogalactan oligomer/maltooligosaccharide transport system permease protein